MSDIPAGIDVQQFNELLRTTALKLEADIIDQVMSPEPTLDLIKDLMTAGDGVAVTGTIRNSTGNRTAVSDALGTFSTTADPDLLGSYLYEYSDAIITPTVVPWRQKTLNGGKNKIHDLVQAHLTAAADDHAIFLANLMYRTPAQIVADPGTPFLSLPALIGNQVTDGTPTPRLNVGGINSATNALWQSTIEMASYAGVTNPANAPFVLRRAFRSLSNDISDATGRNHNVVIAGATVFDDYENSLDAQVAYNALNVGETRFRELKFDGLTIRRDGIRCPATHAYFLTKERLIVRNLAGNFMRPDEAQRIPGTLTDATPFVSSLLLGTNERRAHGRLIWDNTPVSED